MRCDVGVAHLSENSEPLKADPVDQPWNILVQEPDDVGDPRKHNHRAVSFNTSQYGERRALGGPLGKQEMGSAAVAFDRAFVQVHDRKILVDVGLHVAWANAGDPDAQVCAFESKPQ